MRNFFILLIFAFLIAQPLFAQDVNNGWEKWQYMLGEWKGEGSGQPGEGSGMFTLKPKLEEKGLNIRFEMAMPNAPGDFKMYIEGKNKKVKEISEMPK